MKPYIVANWKMNFSISESIRLAEEVMNGIGQPEVNVVLCPSFVSLAPVSKVLASQTVALGAQDVFFEKNGAFTGEVSIEMLKDAGCAYVIVGHSERRALGENNDDVRRKISATLSAGLRAIVCVGETLADRKAGTGTEYVQSQLRSALREIVSEDVLVAYEPIWAIGTGVEAKAEQTVPMLKDIQETLSGLGIAAPILYGGSVKSDNARRFVDEGYAGVLDGSASWQSESFVGIVKAIAD